MMENMTATEEATGEARHEREGKPLPQHKSVFPVEHGIPIPNDVRVDRRFFPWTQLDIGDSFFVPDAKVTSMSAKAAWAGRQYGRQYVCRSIDGGVRVWCLGEKEHKPPRKNHRKPPPPDEPA